MGWIYNTDGSRTHTSQIDYGKLGMCGCCKKSAKVFGFKKYPSIANKEYLDLCSKCAIETGRLNNK